MKLFSTDTLNSSVAVTLTQIMKPRVKWRSGQKAQFTCQTVLKFQSRISRNAFQIDGRYVFSVRLAKKKWRQFTELKPFFVRFDYMMGDQLGKITFGCAVLLGESDWRTDHQLHHSALLAALYCVLFRAVSTILEGFPRVLQFPPSPKSSHAEMGTSQLGLSSDVSLKRIIC